MIKDQINCRENARRHYSIIDIEIIFVVDCASSTREITLRIRNDIDHAYNIYNFRKATVQSCVISGIQRRGELVAITINSNYYWLSYQMFITLIGHQYLFYSLFVSICERVNFE